MEKVTIGWPSGGKVHSLFVQSILELQSFELNNPSEEYVIDKFIDHSGIYVQENRNELVKKFLSSESDWLLQIDSDHSFRPNLLRFLMRTADSSIKPMVSGLYTNIERINDYDESFQIVNCVYREADNGQYSSVEIPKNLQPFEIDAAGTGIFLCHRTVFEKMDYPWFWIELFQNSDGSTQMMNEDLAFCRAAKMAGFSIWCNPMAEATHWKELPMLPSTMRQQLEQADKVFSEMKKGD